MQYFRHQMVKENLAIAVLAWEDTSCSAASTVNTRFSLKPTQEVLWEPVRAS